MENKTNDFGKWDFMGRKKLFSLASLVAIVASIVVIYAKGLNYGIDFAGGTEVQVKFSSEVESSKIREFLTAVEIPRAQVQKFGEDNEFLIRFDTEIKATEKETNELIALRIQKITDGLQSGFSGATPEIRRVDSVGPQIGDQLKMNGLLAVLYSLILILIYVGLRFDYNFAPAAVACLFHDAILTLGIFALIGKEINVQILAAILTIIGYSLNDTIVVFDRIRENLPVFRNKSMDWVMNRSINDTISRTILTSFTTLLAIGALYIFAGGVISDFALCMGIGVAIGTYSTIYVASPLTIYFERFKGAKARA